MTTNTTKNNTTKNNTTINNEVEKENKMNINELINTGININTELPITKNTVEMLQCAERAGIEFDNISMNDNPLGIAMSGDGDREEGIRFMQMVANNAANPRNAVVDFQNVLLLGAALKKEGITAFDSEEDEIDGVPIIINYEVQKAYVGVNGDLVSIADLEDLDCKLPPEAVKALLVERCKNKLAEMRAEAEAAMEEYNDWDEDDDDDDEDCGAVVCGIYMG